MGGVRGQWKLASLYATAKGIGKEIPSVHGGTILQNPTCEVEADSVVVTYLYNLQTSPAAECSLQYRVFGDGRIQTTLHYDPVEGLAAMPEFGVLFKIDADYDTVEWYGNGPAETYWDRQHGAKAGHLPEQGRRQHGAVPCAAGVRCKDRCALGKGSGPQRVAGCCLPQMPQSPCSSLRCPTLPMKWRVPSIPTSCPRSINGDSCYGRADGRWR